MRPGVPRWDEGGGVHKVGGTSDGPSWWAGESWGVRLTYDRVDEIARGQAGAVTTAQLRALGADRTWVTRQVDGGRWQRVHRGVLVTHTGPLLPLTRAWAGLLYAGPGAALSHESAALRHGFTRQVPRVVTVTVPAERRVRPTAGLVVRLRSTPPPASGRPRVVWRADTVVDLVAGATSEDDVVGWVCGAARAGVRRVEVVAAMERRGRFRWSSLLRDVIAEVDAGVESPLERRYHQDVERRHGLPGARLQVRQSVRGIWLRADGIYEGYGVRIELDGDLGHPGGRTDADTWRDNAVLLQTGDRTLRYRWRHVAALRCATAAQVADAPVLGGWTGRLTRCGPRCAAGRPLPFR